MKKVVLGVDRDSFGVNTLKSFLDHIEYYQSVHEIVNGTQRVAFEFSANPHITVYDVFELTSPQSFKFTDNNIIVIETLQQLQDIINRNKLDLTKKYIILSESYWDTTQYQWDNFTYELVYLSWDVIDCQNRLTNRSNLYFHLMDLNMLSKYNPTFDFLCLIGRSKAWRTAFVDKLSKYDLSNTLTSYYGNCLGHSDLMELDIAYDREQPISEFEQKFYKPVHLDTHHHSYNLSYFTKMELFQKTKFSLIVETESELDEYHVTEKTLKCLVLGHPFVVMGTTGYLNFLHKLGFKTFHGIFDESYDTITDINKRMDAVLELAQHVRSIDFYIDDLKEIQEHNINALTKLRNTETYTNFLRLVTH